MWVCETQLPRGAHRIQEGANAPRHLNETLQSDMMDVSGLSEGRVPVSETWLWTASSLSGTMLTSMDVSVLCI